MFDDKQCNFFCCSFVCACVCVCVGCRWSKCPSWMPSSTPCWTTTVRVLTCWKVSPPDCRISCARVPLGHPGRREPLQLPCATRVTSKCLESGCRPMRLGRALMIDDIDRALYRWVGVGWLTPSGQPGIGDNHM